MRFFGNGLLVIVAVLLGFLGAVAALLLAAVVTENRALAMAAGVLGLFIASWGLLRRAARGLSSHPVVQMGLPAAVSTLVLALLAVLAGGLLFVAVPAYRPMFAAPDTQYWELPTGSQIAYTHTKAGGEGQPAPVLLVHGGPGAPEAHQEGLKSALAEAGFEVYDYHQVGAGLSERLQDVREYTVARHIQDLEAIRQTIGAEQVILVGSSWGGQLIANYMAANPQWVAKAVISSPAPIWAPAYTNETRLTAEGNQDVQKTVSDHPQVLLAQILMQITGPGAAHALLPDSPMDGVFQNLVDALDMAPGCPDVPGDSTATLAPTRGKGFWVNAITTRDAQMVADPRPALGQVTAETLVLRGECDYIAWEVTREYRDVLPNAVLLAVDDAGHPIHTHRPEVYRRAVMAFLLGEPLPLPVYTAEAEPW